VSNISFKGQVKATFFSHFCGQNLYTTGAFLHQGASANVLLLQFAVTYIFFEDGETSLGGIVALGASTVSSDNHSTGT
jgi:hypothetical protein